MLLMVMRGANLPALHMVGRLGILFGLALKRAHAACDVGINVCIGYSVEIFTVESGSASYGKFNSFFIGVACYNSLFLR